MPKHQELWFVVGVGGLIWINLIALISACGAGSLSWNAIAKRRLGLGLDLVQPLADRHEAPRLGPSRDKMALAAVAARACSLIVIAALLTGAINCAAPSPFFTSYKGPGAEWLTLFAIKDPQIDWTSWFIAALSAFIAETTLGTLSAFALATAFGLAISTKLSQDRVWSGTWLLPRSSVGWARFEPSRGKILLFSASHPDSLPVTLFPPLPIFLLGLVGAILVAVTTYQIFAEWVWFPCEVEIVAIAARGHLFFNRWFPHDFQSTA